MDPAALALVLLVLVTTYVVGYWQGRARKRPRTDLEPYQVPVVGAGAEAREAFTVVSPDGDLFFEGTSGGDACRVVERLRGNGVSHEFYQNDVRRDWWPR